VPAPVLTPVTPMPLSGHGDGPMGVNDMSQASTMTNARRVLVVGH
jgi:hypothetical protein